MPIQDYLIKAMVWYASLGFTSQILTGIGVGIGIAVLLMVTGVVR